MLKPVILLSIGILLIVLSLGSEYNPILKKYPIPIVNKMLLVLAGICMLLTIIQVR